MRRLVVLLLALVCGCGQQQSTEQGSAKPAILKERGATVVRVTEEAPATAEPAATGLEEFAERLQDPSYQVRLEAVRALIRMDDKKTVPLLISALSDSAGGVVEFSLRQLGALQDVRATLPIVRVLEELPRSSYTLRGFASTALGDIGDVRAVPALAKAFESDDVPLYAAKALGQLCTDQARQILQTGLGHKTDGRKLASALGMENCHEASDVARLRPLIKRRGPSNPEAYPTNDSIRMQAAKTLLAIGTPEATRELERAVDDPVWVIRMIAAKAFSRTRDKYVKELQTLARDKRPEVQAAATQTSE